MITEYESRVFRAREILYLMGYKEFLVNCSIVRAVENDRFTEDWLRRYIFIHLVDLYDLEEMIKLFELYKGLLGNVDRDILKLN